MPQSSSPTPLGEAGDKLMEVEDMPMERTGVKSPQLTEAAMLLFLKENPHIDSAAKRRNEFPADILWAAKYGFTEAVKYLIDNGADLTITHNTTSGRNQSCLHYAAGTGNLSITKLLVNHLGPSKLNEHRDSDGCTVLHIAAHSPDVKLIEFLLDCGADVNAVTSTGHMPLHIAARKGDAGIIGLFISKGANLNASTRIGFTPLMYAAEAGNGTVVMKLLRTKQVDHEYRTAFSGKTALHLAVEGGHLRVVKDLVGFGADVYSQNLFGKGVIDYTLEDLPRGCKYGEAILRLIKSSVN